MLRRKLLILSALIAMAIAVTSCGGDQLGEYQSGPPVAVKSYTVTTADVPQSFEFTGTLKGDKQTRLSTKIMGQITYLPFEEGDKVSKGETLLKIRSDDLEAKKAQVKAGKEEANAALTNIEANYNRIKTLYENKTATQKEMDDIQMAYDMTKAKVKQVEEMEREVNDYLTYSNLKAPIDGYIVMKMAQEGDIAAPGMPLVVIEGMEQLKVVAQVPESQIGLFTIGDEVKIRIDALDRSYAGTVEQVNPGANPASRQFRIQVLLSETDDNLKSGMYAKVVLEKGAREVVAIDEEWLVKRGQLTGVYTLNSNQEAMLRWVRTGKKIDGKIEILSGLNNGETIIAAADGILRDGQKVKVN